MVGNDLLMQFQADLLGVPVIRPKVPETTSLGAAYAAGPATGLRERGEAELRENWIEDKRWSRGWRRPSATSTTYWKRAVTGVLGLAESRRGLAAGGSRRAGAARRPAHVTLRPWPPSRPTSS